MAQNINLLPGGRLRRTRFTLAGVAVMALLLAGGVGMLQWLGTVQLRNGAVELKTLAAQADRLDHELAAGPAAARARQEQLDRDEVEIAALEAVAAHLDAGALGSTLGFADRLEALSRTTTPGVWLTGVRLDNRSSDLTLEGRALEAAQVPVYLATLKLDPLLAGTEFTTLEMLAADDAGKRGAAGTVRFKMSTAGTVGSAGAAADAAGSAHRATLTAAGAAIAAGAGPPR
jgi:outer membrane murein-binding lipoprotein Lpp